MPRIDRVPGKHHIPKAYVIKIFFPKSMGKSEEFILSLVEAQNEGLDIPNYVLWSLGEHFGKLLALGIDENFSRILKEISFKIFGRFWKIPVNAEQEAHVGTVMEEAKEIGEAAGPVRQSLLNQRRP